MAHFFIFKEENKMKKSKIIASVFVVLIAVLLFSVSVYAAGTEYTYGKYKYTITENGTVKITKYTGTSKTVTIPEEINGKTITHIGEKVFGETCPTQKVIIPDCVTTVDNAFDSSNVKTIEIGSGVTEIKKDAFYGAWKLEEFIVSDKNTAYKSVDGILYDIDMKTLIRVPYAKECTKLVIPEGVETIGRNATRYVTLESIVIPSTVKTIDSFGLSFRGAKSLVIPGSVETLEFDAIYGCEGLEKIEIKKGKLKSLDFDDINACKQLKTVIIPENVEHIDRFHYCEALEEIIVSEKNECYTTTDGVLYNKDKTKLLTYPVAKADETYVIPGTVTVIGEDAFNDIYNKPLKKIYMHVGIKEIEQWAFIYSNGISILYEGTKAQFDAVKKQEDFNVLVVDITYNNYIYRPVENIIATAKDTSVTLNWDKVPGATGYRVYVKSDNSWKSLKTTTATKYTAEGLSSGTTYTFAIKSYSKSDGKTVWASDYSTVNVKTKTVSSPPSVTLSTTNYVYDGKNKTPKVTVKDADGNVLTKNVDYKTSVASNRSGIGRYTVKVTFIGDYSGSKNVYFYIKPGKPASVKSASQTTSSVKLSWSAVPGAAGYKVYRYSPSKKAYVEAGTTEGTSLTVKKLYAGTKYTFRVVAYGKTSAGKVYDSDSYALLKTATKTKTPTLSKVTASSTKGKAYVYHSDVSGETGYTVYYSTKKDSGFKKYANFKADTTRCDITGLTSGKTYYFKVRTYIKTDSGYVYSAWSTVKSVTVK